jgi:hypothetical protein
MAILGFPPQGDSPIDTQGGAEERLQVGALVLALAIGDPKRYLWLLVLFRGLRIPVHLVD